jgi:dUTP pyrophosphatase
VSATPATPDVLRVQRLRPDEPFTLPARQHEHDAGLDLCVSRPATVMPYTFAVISTNIAVALPDGLWAMLLARSSTFYKRRLIVHPGVIDSGYRGEVQALVFNPTGDRIVVQEGERLFQLLLHHNIRIDVQEFAYLPPGERGTEGFGSTGGYARPRGTMPGEAQ